MSEKKRPAGRSRGNPAGKPSTPPLAAGELPGGLLTQKGQDVLLAAVEMIGHTGAEFTQVRYCNEEEPTVWNVVGKWGDRYEVGAGMDPVKAALRLLDTVVDGGECQHCHRPTGITEGFDEMPLDKLVCWYQFDPELKKFRRGCA
jgi:hypothetical protein